MKDTTQAFEILCMTEQLILPQSLTSSHAFQEEQDVSKIEQIIH